MVDDNAEHFYKYLQQNTKENIFFLIRKGTKLKSYEFNVIPFGSLRHDNLLMKDKGLLHKHKLINSVKEIINNKFIVKEKYLNRIKDEFF